jgi:hypothetical protein
VAPRSRCDSPCHQGYMCRLSRLRDRAAGPMPPGSVRTFCTVSRRPAGPLAPLSRRQLGAHAFAPATAAPTPVGWRESIKTPAVFDVQQSPALAAGSRVPAPATDIVRVGQNPSRAPPASAPPIFDS